MTTLDTLVEPIRHSPRLPEILDLLERQMLDERRRREKFYDEMTPEQKIEFIDGEVVMHSPAKNQHLDVTLRIATLLRAFVSIKKIGTVKSEKCLCVFPRNDYEPDVVFFGREKAAQLEADTLKFPVPDLVVEVLSRSTEERDRGVKFEDYAANQVGEYWIVDAERGLLEQYVLGDAGYELALKSGSGRVQSTVIEGFETEVEAIFDEDKNLEAMRRLLG